MFDIEGTLLNRYLHHALTRIVCIYYKDFDNKNIVIFFFFFKFGLTKVCAVVKALDTKINVFVVSTSIQ